MPRSGGIGFRNVLLLFIVGILGGATAGFIVRPMILEDEKLIESEKALATEKLAHAEAKATLAKRDEEAKKIDEQRGLLDKQLEAAKQAQEMVADKQADQAKTAADLETAKKKLDGTGTITVQGTELRVSIATGNLFKAGDELAPGGVKILDKVASALKEMPDKQVSVHGHTDDTPPPKPKAAPAPKPKKGEKAVPAPAPEPEFATNWELSSARALAVVHYLQDKHKIEASRLSASAFSQYRPVSKSNKAQNRRIELVLTTKPAKK